MPRWEIHLSFGLMAFVVLLSALFLGLREGLELHMLSDLALPLTSFLLFGGGALLVGSVLPDMDGKGRIRWVIGPVIGAMLLAPVLFGRIASSGAVSGMELLMGRGSLIFLGGTVLAYSSLALPLRHRGILHSPKVGIIFGALWGAFVWYFSGTDPLTSAIIGSAACLGYLWHVALDGRSL
ncbi:hypothetical protein EU522_00190 [Candidatus Thorarchaeota archaeon]|nr:MAG: hypothetical protein EU522_00190 [Candidatus Thorarchaeota archaeon]